MVLGTSVSFAALPENTYDLSYQPPGDDPNTFYHWAEFDGVFWEVNRPGTSAGTGNFDSFLRIQADGTERGYNTNGTVEFDTKTGAWTHAITLSEIPYGTATVNEGAPNEMTFSGFEFMIDINETKPKSIMNVDEYKFWLTGDPLLTGYAPTGGPGPGMQWSSTNPEPVWIGEIDWDFANGVAIDRQLIMDYLVNSGSGHADYRVLIPQHYFLGAIEDYNARPGYTDLTPETAYLVLYVEHSESDAGFEEWGVRVVEKGALTITENFSGYPQGFTLPEVTVNVSNGMGYTQEVVLNMANNWTVTLTGLMPGTYTVVEDNVEGWTTSYPVSDSVDVIADSTATIEIDNAFDEGYLKIMKTWSGEPEGFEDYPEKVTGRITGPYGYDEPFEITGSGWETTVGPLPPGEYTVTEDEVEGWSTTLSPLDGKVMVVAGEMAQAVVIEINNYYDLMLMSETAWRYLPDESEEIWDYVKTKNWGWTTEITEAGEYEFDLYAAAGQNILSNGFKVGIVEVLVTEGSEVGLFDVEVTYIIDEDLDYDYWIDETHVWIGSTPLPTNKKGKMTNAPSSFNYRADISSDGLEATITAYDVEGPFWIALHSVVQWWE